VSAVAIIAVATVDRLAALVLATAIAALLPLVARAFGNGLDILEPLVPASAAFLLLFVARPAFDILHGDLKFLNFDVTDGYGTAMSAALIAVVCFNLGYAVARLPDSVPRRAKRLLGYEEPRRDIVLIAAGLLLSLLGITAALVSAHLAGGLGTLLQERNAIDVGATNVPIISVASTLTIPGALLLWSVTGTSRRRARLLSILPLAALGVTAIPKGDRRLLLPVATAAISLFFLRRDRRPNWIGVFAAGLIVFFVVVTPFRESRYGERSFGEAFLYGIQDPVRAAEGLLAAQDTSQISVVALLVTQLGEGRPLAWQNGVSTLTETLLQPIPRQIWPGKPETIRNQFIQYNWGMASGRCLTQCPTVSIIGSLYADFGLVSVALGCLLLGFFGRIWYLFMLSLKRDPIVTAAYSATLFTFFIVWWSTLGSIVVDFGFYAVPILITGILARQQPTPDPREAPDSPALS
jgi:hypothetical protein